MINFNKKFPKAPLHPEVGHLRPEQPNTPKKKPYVNEQHRVYTERKGRKMIPKGTGALCGSRHRNGSLEDSHVSFTPIAQKTLKIVYRNSRGVVNCIHAFPNPTEYYLFQDRANGFYRPSAMFGTEALLSI